MYLKEHEERCREFFGKPFTEVHRFLDQYAKEKGLDVHREWLHNPYGVAKVVMIYGEEARCAALLHLYDDYEYFQHYTEEGKQRKDIYDYIYDY